MDRNQAKQLLPIISAFSEGRPIQYRIKDNKSAKWNDVDKNYHEFSPHSFMYRIKPEPKYRPFANAEECLAEMQKHQLFGWVKNQGLYRNIANVMSYSIIFADNEARDVNYEQAFKNYTFTDGTPFGIKEEE